MVAPGWVAHVKSGGFILSQEFADDTKSTSSREGLDSGDVFTANKWAIKAKDNTLSALVELGETFDTEVLLIEGSISDDSSLSLADNGEHIRLSIVVTVSTDTEVDLLGVLISLESGCKGEDGVGWCLWHVLKLIVQGGKSLHE